MKTIKIDGVDYQAEPQVIAAMHQLTTKLDEAQKAHAEHADALAAVEAERDAMKEKLDAAQEELKQRADATPEAIQAAVKARLDLAALAAKANVQITADQSDADVKLAIVKAVYPKADDAKLAQPAYLEARLDQAREDLADVSHDSRNDSADVPAGGKPAPHADATDAHAKMRADLESAWQK